MVTIEKSAKRLNAQELARFARRAQKAARLPGDVDVLITSSRRMQALNSRFRSKNKPTDVLAFPANPSLVNDQRWSGDIAISAQIAAGNARRYGHSVGDEIKVLILHGMLHLAGYDHEGESPAGRMARRERVLRGRLRLPSALTERAAAVTDALEQRTKRRRR